MDPTDGELKSGSCRFGLGWSLGLSNFASLAAFATFASFSCHLLNDYKLP